MPCGINRITVAVIVIYIYDDDDEMIIYAINIFRVMFHVCISRRRTYASRLQSPRLWIERAPRIVCNSLAALATARLIIC